MISRNVVWYIEDILYKNDFKLPRQLLGQFIYQNIDKMNLLGSIKEMTEFIKESYSVNHPSYINRIAYDFLHEDIAKFSIKLFPLNSNVKLLKYSNFLEITLPYESSSNDLY